MRFRMFMSHREKRILIDVDADVFVYELVERSLENPDLGLPYLSVLSNTDETAKQLP